MVASVTVKRALSKGVTGVNAVTATDVPGMAGLRGERGFKGTARGNPAIDGTLVRRG